MAISPEQLQMMQQQMGMQQQQPPPQEQMAPQEMQQPPQPPQDVMSGLNAVAIEVIKNTLGAEAGGTGKLDLPVGADALQKVVSCIKIMAELQNGSGDIPPELQYELEQQKLAHQKDMDMQRLQLDAAKMQQEMQIKAEAAMMELDMKQQQQQMQQQQYMQDAQMKQQQFEQDASNKQQVHDQQLMQNEVNFAVDTDMKAETHEKTMKEPTKPAE